MVCVSTVGRSRTTISFSQPVSRGLSPPGPKTRPAHCARGPHGKTASASQLLGCRVIIGFVSGVRERRAVVFFFIRREGEKDRSWHIQFQVV